VIGTHVGPGPVGVGGIPPASLLTLKDRPPRPPPGVSRSERLASGAPTVAMMSCNAPATGSREDAEDPAAQSRSDRDDHHPRSTFDRPAVI